MTIKSPSKYFNNYTWKPRQAVMENMIMQAIKMNGTCVKYLPRTETIRDELFGDDTYSRFNDAVELDAYVKNVDQMGGAQDTLSRFGFYSADQLTLVITRKQWDEVRTEKMVMENDFTYQTEETDSYEAWDTNCFELEAGGMDGYEITFEKPRPGDLIYLEINQNIFEITHVEHEALFYQFGKLMTYELTCELFRYTSEEFRTTDETINSIEDVYSVATANSEFLTEIGDDVIIESGSNLEQEEYALESKNLSANNTTLTRAAANNVVDWSEVSPFSQTDRW